MAEETLEDKVADAQGAKKEEKPNAPTRWQSGLKEIREGASAATNLAVATGANLLSALKYGFKKGFILTSSFPIGAAIHEYARADGKGSFSSAKLRDESVAGLVFTGMTVTGVDATLQVPKALGLEGAVSSALGLPIPVDAAAVAGTTFFVLNPSLNLAYYPIQYLIRKKTFRGMWTNLKKEYIPSLKRTLWLNALTSTVMAGVYTGAISGALLYPYFALSAIGYRVLMSSERVSYKKLGKALGYTLLSPVYVPYKILQGAATFAKPVYRSAKGTAQTAYAIGKTLYEKISGFFTSTAKKASEAVQPQGTPATAGAH